MSDQQQVTFQGGQMDGAVLSVPAANAVDVAARHRHLTITPAGRVYDRQRERYVTADVLELPAEQRPRRWGATRPDRAAT
jgi:hypothetical protein